MACSQEFSRYNRPMTRLTRPRVCAAIFRNNTILMVRHVHRGMDYWTLPGGGVHDDETLREAAAREVLEETGLQVSVARFLYDETYSLGTNYCFEALVTDDQEIQLGVDPEDADKPLEERILRDVAWRPLDEVRDDRMVEKVLRAVNGSSDV